MESLVPISGLFSPILFKSVFPRVKATLILAKLLFYLRHKGNNIYHSNKGTNSLSSLLLFLSSASRHEYPFPVLINKWIKVHLKVECFIEKLITDPDFTVTSQDALIICHKIRVKPPGFTWLERSLQSPVRWLWRLEWKLNSRESIRAWEGPPKISITMTHTGAHQQVRRSEKQ